MKTPRKQLANIERPIFKRFHCKTCEGLGEGDKMGCTDGADSKSSLNLIIVRSYLMNFELVGVEPPRPRDDGRVAVDSVLLRGSQFSAAAAKVGVLRKGENLQCNVAS